MRKPLLVLMTAILISSTLLGPYEIAQGNDEVQPTSSDSWLMFRHDVQHTGFSTSTAPGDNKTIGGLIWNFSTGGEVHSSAAVVDDVVFIGSNDHKIYALNATTGAEIWNKSVGDLVRSSPAVADDTVFIGSDDKQIYALNKTNGDIIWSYPTNGPIRSSPVVAGDLIIIGSGAPDNNVYALNKTGHLQWKQKLNGSVTSSPAVADGIVYVGSLDWNVYALNMTNGEIIKPYPTNGSISSSPTIALGLVFVGSDDGKLYALHEKTLDFNWSALTGDDPISSSPAFADGFVFVGSEDKSVYAFNATTGEQKWRKETGGIVGSSPAVADGKVFVGSNDHKLYALSQTTGDIIWTYQTGDAIESSPTIAEGKVFVGSKDKRVYAFGPNERPAATFSFKPEKPIENEAIEFDASNSSDPDYNDHIVKYEWDFGDNNKTSTTNPKIIHKYAASRIYNVTLTVTDTHQASGSNFSYIEVLKHDVAVIDVEPLDAWVELGKIINISITVENLGDFNEYSLNVTAYADMNEAPLQDEIRIGPTTISSLEPKETSLVLISWNTSATEAQRGNYKISANISQVKDEYEIDNNMFRDEYITVKIHDVAVTSVTTNKTFVQRGETAYINVTVENQGDFAENVTITVYANDTSVTWGNLTQLAPGRTETKTLDWNTAGFENGSYMINATASIIPIDNDPSDDYMDDVEIIVTPPALNHDIAVFYVEPDYDSVFWSVSLYINVTILNQGKADESNIAVFAYAVNTVTEELFGIGTKTITYLPRGVSKVLRFKWDTESTPKYEITTKYKIAANATLATDEDPSNNHNSAEVYIRPFIHDVAITKVTPLEGVTKPIIIGSPAHINVTAENLGAFFEDVSVVAYAALNATVIGDEDSIGPPIIISLPSLGSEIISFTWNTTGVAEGNYTISANATIADDKVLSNNCKSSDLEVSLSEPWIHDISVTDIKPLKTILCKDRYNATILVTVKNEGHFEETFSVTLNAIGYMTANNYTIGIINVTLPPGSNVTLAFEWNSSGVVKGIYSLVAKAGPVIDETDTGDNIRWRMYVIQITMEGDITGDGKVDIKDVAPIAAGFGAVRIDDPASPKYCEYWHSSPCPNCPHNPNCDITCDGKIDIKDVAIAAKNFGKIDP